MKIGVALAGAFALAGVFAVASAQAATLTIDLTTYDTSAVQSPGGQTLAIVTVKDLLGGGVSVDYALDVATLFASTGGGHITAGFNLDKAITAADVTVTTPSPPTFKFVSPVNGVPGPGAGFGDFTAGLQGNWKGTSNSFAGPIDFDIAGISTSDFVQNSKGFMAVADVLGNKGTGEAGGAGTIVGTPEASTWAMMLLGFAGLGFAGYRKAQGGRIAPSVA